MDLDRSLLKEFAKVTNDSEKKEENKYLRGTIVNNENTKYVQLDGSSTITPISNIVDVEAGDRVLVSIENHTATIIGNFTFPPSARKEDQALTAAGNAQTAANGAVETANASQILANQASTKADTAISQANQANVSAAQAISDAASAISSANSANTNANEAKSLATQANTNANTAVQNAASAQSAVADANAEITRIKSDVSNAQDDIQDALDSLNDQADDIDYIKQNYATDIEVGNVQASLQTEITTKIGQLQTTIAQDYSTKTENVALEGRLQTQITQNANDISSHAGSITTLQADTAQAQQDVATALANASAAQDAADAAQADADAAQAAADAAQADADAADAKADAAQTAATNARTVADAADAAVQSAQQDLAEAIENLDNVTSRVDATEEDIAEAQQDVAQAQQDVNTALANAAAASQAASNAANAASQAQTDATNAHGIATQAQTAANNAQTAANNAAAAASQAQQDVAALTSRVTTNETNIAQNSTNIALNASAIDEIGDDLENNYYDKTETDSQINISAGIISSEVSTVRTIATNANNKIDNLEIGARNLIPNTLDEWSDFTLSENETVISSSTDFFGIQEGESYTLQIKLNISASREATVGVRFYTDESTKYYVYSSETVSDGEGQLLLTSVLTSEQKTYDQMDIIIIDNVTTYVEDTTEQYKELQLEKGNKPTDWRKAPEDVDDDIGERATSDDLNRINSDLSTQIISAQSSLEQLANMISTLVTDGNGNSLMTQTSTGWTFNMGNVNSNLDTLRSSIETMEQHDTDMNSNISSLTNLINAIASKTAYITMATDDGGNPCIELGKTDSIFKVRITNTSIDFLEGSTKVAYANNNTFYSVRSVVENDLQIGKGPGFVWRTRANGNLGLVYIS